MFSDHLHKCKLTSRHLRHRYKKYGRTREAEETVDALSINLCYICDLQCRFVRDKVRTRHSVVSYVHFQPSKI
jgi:hypothetical protein